MLVAILLILQILRERLVDIEATPHLYRLFVAAQDGHKRTERGAFLTRDKDGKVDLVLWPRTMQQRGARFRGIVPPETVAVAHTHPDGHPHPSQHDVEEAMRIGLPIYVVSRTAIARVDPTGLVTYVVDRAYWVAAYEAARRRPRRASASP